MKSFLNILKLFFLDWSILVVMYGIGLIIVRFDPRGYGDVVALLGVILPSPAIVDLITYLLIDLFVIIFISYLLNKHFIKVSIKNFVLSQLLFTLSIPLTIFLATI